MDYHINMQEVIFKKEIDSIFNNNPLTIDKLHFTKYSDLYAFTTENLSGFFQKLPLDHAKVLTVNGSGDHAINSVMYGAKEILAFDINILTGLLLDLKIVGMRKLNLEQYLDFFMRFSNDGCNNLQALDINTYESIRNYVNWQTRYFFDKAYEHFDCDGKLLRDSKLFNTLYDFNTIKINSNPYLQSKKNFNSTRKLINQSTIVFKQSSINDIAAATDSKYDVILLSNITDYLNVSKNLRMNLKSFADKVVLPLSKRLNPGGVLCPSYIYDIDMEGCRFDYRAEIENPKLRRKVMRIDGMIYQEYSFKSIMQDKEDGIILLRK